MKKVLFVVGGDVEKYSRLRAIKDAFEKFDYKVDSFNYRRYRLNLLSLTNWMINKALILKAKKIQPDFLFVYKGESILPGTIKNIGITSVNRTVDDPFGTYVKFLKIKNFDEYDYAFTFDRAYVDKLSKILPTYYLPLAAPTNFYKPLNLDKIYDVTFIGSYYKEREKALAQIHNVKIWGPNWDNSKLQIQQENSKEENYVRILNQSKITLNFLHKHHKLSTNYRTFEATACRTFILNEYNPELENLFDLGKEIETFKTVKELKSKIKYYLENEDEREKIAERGYKRTLKEHKIEDRVMEVIKVVADLKKG